MILTQITDSETLSQIILETLLNTTNKITKISDASVVRGYANGMGKLGNKALKDVAVVEARLFPDTAYGIYLDEIAQRQGNVPRLGSSGSSTYLRLVADPSTTYLASTHFFKSDTGLTFVLASDVTIGLIGFAYVKVSSQTAGTSSNCDPLTITSVTPIPAGHQYVINEYGAQGGRDQEDDSSFRTRISKGINDLSNNATSTLEQALIKVNNRVSRIRHSGIDNYGRTQITILTVDGGDLSSTELTLLQNQMEKIFTITKFRPENSDDYLGVSLLNQQFQAIDISFRCSFLNGFTSSDVIKNIQISMNKYFDYRFWTKQTVIWTDLLQLVKNVNGVDYCPDNHFVPGSDIAVNFDLLPRIRGFQVLDLSGNIIVNTSGTLNPVYFPSKSDLYFNSSVLGWIA